jgi:hypothetical protein
MVIKKILILIAIAGSCCAAVWAYLHSDMSSLPLNAKEQQMIDTLFEKTKPQCIGRYIYQVPLSFANDMNDGAEINEIEISSERLYRPVFEQRIRLREQELKNEETMNPKNAPYLKQVIPLKNLDAIIFDSNRNSFGPGYGRTLEAHLYSNGVAFTVTTDIMDFSDPKFHQDKREYLAAGAREQFLDSKYTKLAEMQNLLSRLKGRKDDEVPTEAGTCIAEGFIADNNKKNKEEFHIRYTFDDFIFAAKSYTTLVTGDTLFERSNDIEPILRTTGYNTIRKDKFSLPGLDAQEWLISGKQEVNDRQVNAYNFVLYANEKMADYHHPVLSIILHNSSEDTKTYSSEQLVEIWDRIIKTFQLRQGAF